MTTTHLSRFAAIGLTALLAACASTVPGQDKKALTPTQQFAAKVSAQPEEVRLAIHAQGLSPRQADALSRFIDFWRDDEGGMIGIQTPQDGVDASAAYRMSESARSFLISHGVPPDQVELVGYTPDGQGPAHLLIGYLRYKAEIPKCGTKWTSITGSWQNNAQPNFGCAVTANMAAQTADPADLLGPRTMTPQDASRRQNVLDKYRTGEVTSSAKDDQAKGTVSNSIQ